MKVESDKEWYTFFYKLDDEWMELGRGLTAMLCTETTYLMTYTGVYIGLFSEKGTASFADFELKVKEEK